MLSFKVGMCFIPQNCLTATYVGTLYMCVYVYIYMHMYVSIYIYLHIHIGTIIIIGSILALYGNEILSSDSLTNKIFHLELWRLLVGKNIYCLRT